MVTKKPIPTSGYIMLRGIKDGNKFYCHYSPNDKDPTKLCTGEVVYEITGYAETIEECQITLYGRYNANVYMRWSN